PLRREPGALGRGELGAPLDVGCKLRLYGAKLLLRERLAVAPERHDDFVTEPHDSLLPSWVDTGGQIERPPGLDVRKRQLGGLGCVMHERHRSERLVERHRAIHCLRGLRIEFGEAATREVVRDLVWR